MALFLRARFAHSEDTSEDTIVLQVNILNILLNLFKLFLVAAPLLTRQVVHDELWLLSRNNVLLIEQRFEVLLIRRLEATDQVQGLTHVQLDDFLVHVVADILYNADPFWDTDRFHAKLLA